MMPSATNLKDHSVLSVQLATTSTKMADARKWIQVVKLMTITVPAHLVISDLKSKEELALGKEPKLEIYSAMNLMEIHA